MEYGFFTEEIIREKVPAVHMHVILPVVHYEKKKMQKKALKLTPKLQYPSEVSVSF
jgi:hypothetical protein